MSLPFICAILLVSHLTIVTSLLSTKIIIDIDKGIALDQIGLYSNQLEESFLHIFIPIINYCTISAVYSTVCEYIQSSEDNVVHMGTVISLENTVVNKYDKENVLNVIDHDIRKLLSYRQIEKFIEKTKSIVFHYDDNFYVAESADIHTPNDRAVNTHQREPIHQVDNPITLALEQLSQGQIGFGFLTKRQKTEILSLPLLSVNEPFDLNRLQESMDTFKSTIIGQSVHLVKSCSIPSEGTSSNDSSCLAVSTLYRRIPMKAVSVYTVYRMIPLPVVTNGQKYVYSSLPTVLGINKHDKTIVQWNEKEFAIDCISSHVIQCRQNPLSMSLSSVPCISDLLSTTKNSGIRCEVGRSAHTEPGVMKMKGDIWLFYSINQSYECVAHSSSHTNATSTTISEPSLVRLPCEQSVHCSDVHLPPTGCLKEKVTVKSSYGTNSEHHFSSAISIKAIAKRLVSIHETTAESTFRRIRSKIEAGHFSLTENLEEIFSLGMSIILSIIVGILILIFKYYKAKIQKNFNKLQVDVNKLHGQYLDEV